jgi:prophage tail gpP-like protein
VNDELTLVVGGTSIRGWMGVRVTRGVERLPSDFEITMTGKFPGQIDTVSVVPGDKCQVLLGSDVVITGYIDRFTPSIGPDRHTIRVTGRGMCCDLVDCSAEWPGCQISGTNALDVATKLAKPYGIKTKLADGAPVGPSIPQFNLILGETAWELIERVCRFSALLAYEQADGSLLLSQVGTKAHASGFQQGINVEAASIAYSVDHRYSDYRAFLQSIQTLYDLGNQGYDQLAHVVDATVNRHRQMDIIAEAVTGGPALAKARALWEKSRRWGRSFECHLTTDNWRDGAGQLWQPNMLAQLDLPILKTAHTKWIIGEVTYRLDEQGTHADLVLMPPEAFMPQPTLLIPPFSMQIAGQDPDHLTFGSGLVGGAQ